MDLAFQDFLCVSWTMEDHPSGNSEVLVKGKWEKVDFNTIDTSLQLISFLDLLSTIDHTFLTQTWQGLRWGNDFPVFFLQLLNLSFVIALFSHWKSHLVHIAHSVPQATTLKHHVLCPLSRNQMQWHRNGNLWILVLGLRLQFYSDWNLTQTSWSKKEEALRPLHRMLWASQQWQLAAVLFWDSGALSGLSWS